MKKLLVAAAVTAGMMGSALIGAGTADAALYEYTYTDTIFAANTAGISVGDSYVTNLFINAGSVSNQDFGWASTAGFTTSAGSYHASHSVVWSSNFDLQTDASGNVVSVAFYGTDFSSVNVDNFGTFMGDDVFGGANFCDSNNNCNFPTDATFNIVANWTFNGVVSTPEPAGAAMLGVGLLGLGFVRRRR